MSENTNMETQQQTTTPTPEETGGRMFTQEEVNRIVSDRLARERAKAERFKATVDKLAQLPGGLCSSRNLVHVDLFPSCSFNSGGKTDILADAFKPPKI